MKSIDEYEAIRNLNPCTDKLGRDRDFKENVNQSFRWVTDKLLDVDQRLAIIESLLKKK